MQGEPGPSGEIGKPGQPGVAGKDGKNGKQGEIGKTGKEGPKGDRGNEGPAGKTGVVSSSWELLASAHIETLLWQVSRDRVARLVSRSANLFNQYLLSDMSRELICCDN